MGRSPAVLAERVHAYAAVAEPAVSASAGPSEMSSMLVDGACRALAGALAQSADRSAALDLLAGDALVTLALLARAETAPESLGALARELLRPERLTTGPGTGRPTT
jgi:hypothetical protein